MKLKWNLKTQTPHYIREDSIFHAVIEDSGEDVQGGVTSVDPVVQEGLTRDNALYVVLQIISAMTVLINPATVVIVLELVRQVVLVGTMDAALSATHQTILRMLVRWQVV